MQYARTVLELFDGHPERWTKQALARSARGKAVPPTRVAEVRFDTIEWDLFGAMCKVYEANFETGQGRVPFADIRDKVDSAIRNQFPDRFGVTSIIIFNDHPDTTFEDVISVLREAQI